tara:strand:- start:29 stop:367 length:339 start_codon:yes stop_codon:yes gene_type:complete
MTDIEFKIAVIKNCIEELRTEKYQQEKNGIAKATVDLLAELEQYANQRVIEELEEQREEEYKYKIALENVIALLDKGFNKHSMYDMGIYNIAKKLSDDTKYFADNRIKELKQ